MIDRTTPIRLATLSLLCALAPAFAGNFSFLNDSPLAKMNDEDLQIMQAATQDALDSRADGQPLHWENSQTGASGVLTPLDTFTKEGTDCRRLEMRNEFKGTTGTNSTFVFCRQPDGSWKSPARSPADPAVSR